MNKHGLTAENILASFPPALQSDKSAVALAEGIAAVLAQRTEEISSISIYPRIDQLDEKLLDILAYDFKVDWWDADYSLEEKRQTLKDSWRVHKTMGTKAAVVTAISAIFPNTEVQEWFEYGGQPYHFRLNINIGGDQGDVAKQRRVLERLNFYKNLRSHLDEVEYFIIAGPAVSMAGVCFVGSHTEISVDIPVPPEVGKPHIKFGIKTGGVLGVAHQRISAEVALSGEVQSPHVHMTARSGVSTYGTAQRIVVEIPADGPQ